MARKIVAGNWKMNLSKNEAMNLMSELSVLDEQDVDVIVFPSFPLLSLVVENTNQTIQVGAQNFSEHEKGAFTGEVSITQLKSIEVSLGLIGHSERRSYFNEDHKVLKQKVDSAVKEGFEFIFCCGEPLEIRDAGNEIAYVINQLEESLFHLKSDQMKNVVIAYEPVWAIGTGRTASSDQAEEMHAAIREHIKKLYGEQVSKSVTILYGGSCNPGNAKELFSKPNVDGGLIGGASLNAPDFLQIIDSF